MAGGDSIGDYGSNEDSRHDNNQYQSLRSYPADKSPGARTGVFNEKMLSLSIHTAGSFLFPNDALREHVVNAGKEAER
jgi:hypothetical protein